MADQDTRYRSLSAAGLGAEDARRIVVATLEARPGLVVHELGPDRISVARTRRPTWAAVACALTIWLGGLGLLFLLVKQTDAGEVVLRDGPRGCVVALPPVLDHGAIHELEVALAGAATDPAGPAGSGPDPARPVDDLGGRTVARSELAAPPLTPAPPHLLLRFAAGTVEVEAGRPVVLGRDPSSTADATGRVVPGDATTVSKSHLLVDFDGTTATVQDLGSTNGSSVVRDGDARTLVAGAPAAVVAGDRVRLGNLELVVETGVAT